MTDFTGIMIQQVVPESIAEELGLEAGDKIININGLNINDFIDYKYQIAGEEIEIQIEKCDGSCWIYEIEKEYDEDLGIEFTDLTGDGIRQCRNRCVFCFVDQMPPKMRGNLYVKDDDYRHSFIHGNFITLTNVTDEDLQRIVSFHLSPLYVSVHTTNPELRVKMLRNKNAGQILEQLKYLTEHGIEIHAQIVLCPGINDEQELQTTISDLADFWPHLKSLAVVPVGLTRFRKDLPFLKGYDETGALKVLNIIENYQRQYLKKFNSRFIFASDEFYLTAGVDLPGNDFYENFPQIENGVGSVRIFMDEFSETQNLISEKLLNNQLIIVTGMSAFPILKRIVDDLNHNVRGNHLRLVAIENHFFGPSVTVTGLLTGQDLIRGLKPYLRDSTPKTTVILSEIMFNKDQLSLDNMAISDLASQLGVKVEILSNHGFSLANYIFDIDGN